ncbi:anti-sigma factor [Schaalia sp. 19OD2882]|uniref:anti-sigma factor n=1 Tax=Schaalia sp. 19OD2882 TaxID=2794089 RepID=UPI001C1F0AB5|nr:anti-sigma factor [Schaalia sp. 19OD2882]QWW20114.1 anti-sigma factor [Schaalia sp. 19OD2882]
MNNDVIGFADPDVDPELTGILGACLAPVAPPPRIRVELLDAIARTPQFLEVASAAPVSNPLGADLGYAEEAAGTSLPGSSLPGPTGPGSMRPPAARATAEGLAPVVPLRGSPRRLLRPVAQVAAAVVLLVAGVGIGRWTTMDDMQDTSHFATLNQMQDVERVKDTMPDGHVATLTWSPGMGMTAVTLPKEMTPEAGKQLQVWVRKDGRVSPAGVYEPRGDGEFAFIDLMPEPGLEVFITLEPAGGSAHPTSDPLVVMRVGEESSGLPSVRPEGAGEGATGEA